MCKIVPRYALHHRVASSPPALFLPLAFFRVPFISALPSIFRVSYRACFFWLLSTCRFTRIFLCPFPLDPLRVFLLDHRYTFFYYVYLFSFCLHFLHLFPAFLIFHDLFIFCSYFSLALLFLRIFYLLRIFTFTSPSYFIYGFAIFFGSFLPFVSLR